ncbi:hypothetical protein [Brevibacillus laterosporus]|uniref:hypothetical protein n=1 Tax=Brevibacillus laterosporus TaxID=1465 RepID=UPI00264F4E5F|nr:hypothetical protein [Brevibacillus laterosporus]MDN9011219.1 hypothetical protein [Brevibacillus laterosporus]MDO0942242.1 hypothetical protein [Brevibacillus laterosporus]
MKKVFASLLSLAMIMSISGSAFAASETVVMSKVNASSIFYDIEPNNSIYEASPFGVPGSVKGKTDYNNDKEDFYKFTAPSYGTLQLVLTPLSKDTEFMLGLYYPNGAKVVAESNDGGPGDTQVILTDVNKGQEYIIKVRHSFNYGGGHYLLNSSIN